MGNNNSTNVSEDNHNALKTEFGRVKEELELLRNGNSSSFGNIKNTIMGLVNSFGTTISSNPDSAVFILKGLKRTFGKNSFLGKICKDMEKSFGEVRQMQESFKQMKPASIPDDSQSSSIPDAMPTVNSFGIGDVNPSNIDSIIKNFDKEGDLFGGCGKNKRRTSKKKKISKKKKKTKEHTVNRKSTKKTKTKKLIKSKSIKSKSIKNKNLNTFDDIINKIQKNDNE